MTKLEIRSFLTLANYYMLPQHWTEYRASNTFSLYRRTLTGRAISDFIKETGRFILHDDDLAPDVSIDALTITFMLK